MGQPSFPSTSFPADITKGHHQRALQPCVRFDPSRCGPFWLAGSPMPLLLAGKRASRCSIRALPASLKTWRCLGAETGGGVPRQNHLLATQHVVLCRLVWLGGRPAGACCIAAQQIWGDCKQCQQKLGQRGALCRDTGGSARAAGPGRPASPPSPCAAHGQVRPLYPPPPPPFLPWDALCVLRTQQAVALPSPNHDSDVILHHPLAL